MGSFNVACSISGLSINGGEKVAYILLEEAKHRYKIGNGNNLLIHSNCFYNPVTLPIFGTYDEYGRVEDVDQDTNVEIIEAHFKAKVRDLVECNVKPISSGMFIHKEIYETLIKKCSSVDDSGHNYALKVNLSKRYDEFVKDLAEAKKQSEHYKKSLEKYIEKGGKALNRAVFKLEIFLKEQHNLFNFRNYPTFRQIYLPHIKKGELKEDLVKFAMFETGMYVVNRFYFPAMNGCQFGNPWASKKLYLKALKISKSEIIEHSDNS